MLTNKHDTQYSVPHMDHKFMPQYQKKTMPRNTIALNGTLDLNKNSGKLHDNNQQSSQVLSSANLMQNIESFGNLRTLAATRNQNGLT